MAIRDPQRGDFEQILASNIAAAVFAKPLDKIRIILEALFLLPEEEQLVVAGDKGNLQYIRELYEVAVSMSNLTEAPPPAPYAHGRFASIPWSFPINHSWKYLQHFIIGTCDLSNFLGEDRWSALTDGLAKGEEKARKDYLNALAEWLGSTFAPLGSCKMIESKFCVRIMPYASKLLREIFSRYITKETWEQTLALVGGRKPGAEQTWK
jgi:hypothetical protein